VRVRVRVRNEFVTHDARGGMMPGLRVCVVQTAADRVLAFYAWSWETLDWERRRSRNCILGRDQS